MDVEVQEAKLSADMAARVAAVTALSQLAQLASQQRQLPDSPSTCPDAHRAGAYLPSVFGKHSPCLLAVASTRSL